MEIITNNQPRELKCFHDLPASAQADFDYIENEDDRGTNRFFCYRGSWYDTHEFETTRLLRQPELLPWIGYQSDTYFSGVVIRYANDWEDVIVGRYCS